MHTSLLGGNFLNLDVLLYIMINRRDFLKGSMILGGAISLEHTLSPLASATIKFFDPKTHHAINLYSEHKQIFDSTFETFKLPLSLVLGVIEIEDGKPYINYPTGDKVHSGTGCWGMPQMTYTSFCESKEWSAQLAHSRNKRGINFDTPLLDIKISENLFRSLFKSAQVRHDGDVLDSISIQANAMGSYLNKLSTEFGNINFGIIAYNWGIGTVVKSVSIHSGISLDSNNLKKTREVIRQNNIDPYTLQNNPLVRGYLHSLKAPGSPLRYLKIDYLQAVTAKKNKIERLMRLKA